MSTPTPPIAGMTANGEQSGTSRQEAPQDEPSSFSGGTLNMTCWNRPDAVEKQTSLNEAEALRDENIRLRNEHARLRDEYIELRNERDIAYHMVEAADTKMDAAVKEKNAAIGEMNTISAQINTAFEQKHAAEEQRDDFLREVDELRYMLTIRVAEVHVMQNMLDNLEAENTRLRELQLANTDSQQRNSPQTTQHSPPSSSSLWFRFGIE